MKAPYAGETLHAVQVIHTRARQPWVDGKPLFSSTYTSPDTSSSMLPLTLSSLPPFGPSHSQTPYFLHVIFPFQTAYCFLSLHCYGTCHHSTQPNGSCASYCIL